MAETSIGKLNVKIAADATGFQNVIAQSQKSLSIFAAKAALPFTMGLGAAAALSRPMETILGPIEKITEMIPGLEKFSFLFDPGKYASAMTEIKEAALELGRSAALLDVDPEFLKALRLSAGPLADELMPALQKLVRFQEELRKGGEGAVVPGGKKASAIAEAYGIDPQQFANLSNQELIKAFGDRLKQAKEEGNAFALVADVMGTKMTRFKDVLADVTEGTTKWLEKMKELGIDVPASIEMAKTVAYMEKVEKLEAEAVKTREFLEAGGPRMGARLGMAQAGTWKEYGEELSRYMYTFRAYQSFLEQIGLGGTAAEAMDKSPKFVQMMEDAKKDISGKPAVQLKNSPIDQLNDSLEEQIRLTELTADGWLGVERQMLEVGKIAKTLTKDEDFEKLAGVYELLGRMAATNVDKALESKIRGAIGGFKEPDQFASVALAGSAEAAKMVNRQFTTDATGGLLPTAEQIRDIMKTQEARADRVELLVRAVKDVLTSDQVQPANQ